MPNDPVKHPSNYPIHWHDCVNWLAARKSGEVAIVDLDPSKARPKPRSVMRKLQTFRASLEIHSTLGYNAREMIDGGELHFEQRGRQIFAIRRPRTRKISEILDGK